MGWACLFAFICQFPSSAWFLWLYLSSYPQVTLLSSKTEVALVGSVPSVINKRINEHQHISILDMTALFITMEQPPYSHQTVPLYFFLRFVYFIIALPFCTAHCKTNRSPKFEQLMCTEHNVFHFVILFYKVHCKSQRWQHT